MKDLHEDNTFGSIRERLGRYEEAPSEELWNRIASQKREGVAWPVWLAAGSAVLVAGFLVFSFEGQKETKKVEPATKNEISEVKVKEPTSGPATAMIVEESSSLVAPSSSEAPTQIVAPAQTVAQPETGNYKPEIIKKTDSITTSSPIVKPKQDSSGIKEVVPPYKKPRSKFQLYFSVTPSLSFQKIIPSGNDDVIIQGLSNRSPLSIKRFGFAIDAGLQYELNKIFGFYGGLSFYRQQQQISYNYYDKNAEVTRAGDSWTFEINRPQHVKTFDYTMTNLGAQGGVLVTLKGEKLKNKFGAGLNYTHNLNASSSYLAYQVFYRSEIRINDRMSWFVQPIFTYSFITKEKLDEPFALKPYRAGISGGMLYRFR